MESIVGLVKNWDKITVHSPFFVINTPFCPPKMYLALMHYQTLRYFHCRDNMIKINTFIMAVIKTYCLFHFRTEICYFLRIFFILSIFAPPPKMHFASEYFEDFSHGT